MNWRLLFPKLFRTSMTRWSSLETAKLTPSMLVPCSMKIITLPIRSSERIRTYPKEDPKVSSYLMFTTRIRQRLHLKSTLTASWIFCFHRLAQESRILSLIYMGKKKSFSWVRMRTPPIWWIGLQNMRVRGEPHGGSLSSQGRVPSWVEFHMTLTAWQLYPFASTSWVSTGSWT